MANGRIVLQPIIEVTSTTLEQEIRFAVPSGGAKSGSVFINVHKNLSTKDATISIVGASARNLLDPATGTNSFWLLIASVLVTAGAVGGFTKVSGLTDIPDLLRWKISGHDNNIQFEIVIELYDR